MPFRRKQARRTLRHAFLFITAAVMCGAVALVLSYGNLHGKQSGRRTVNIGEDRLIGFESLPETEGPMCEMQEASAGRSLMEALHAQQSSGAAEQGDPRPSDAARADASKRPPAHVMRDPSAAFSGVAVDLANDEVVLTDENNFSIMTYSRTENTPPSAKMSEPKRMIAGMEAYLEFNCSVYVDPKSGDIYSVNNDTLNWLTVFDRNVKGNQPPTRKLRAPHTVFGIAVDEERQEMLLAEQDDHAIVIFKKNAKDEDSPVRVIQGSKTQLADPHGIAIDSKAGLIFVTNWGSVNVRPELGDPNLKPVKFGGVERTMWPVTRDNTVPGSGKVLPPSITVYSKDASGNVAPLRVITGPKTQMNWPSAIAVDPEHGEMFVANDTADTVTVYKTDASGDAAPIRVIKGTNTMVKNPTGVAYDSKHEELWVANFGSHSATVFKRTADGNATPVRVIRSAPPDAPSPMMGNPHTIAFDTKREEILVSN
jgi:DNA-binding beta-propeller fold protein YncE